jgi:DNA invertase Pin-like site-specific DNA recombinase
MHPADEHRIAKRHLDRPALVYVRQSDPKQVRVHTESTRLQRGLQEKALELGWIKPKVIEDDLGITASGFADRPGFQWMLTQVTLRKVGIIFCIDASRLSRNSKDWAHLFEMCGYFDTLVADLLQVYDISIPNDRLVLQIKGTVAELELSNMKARLRAGAESKAARGELKMLLPPGYVYDGDDQIVIDPDARVQQAIRAMFERFEQCTSVRQLAMSYRDTNTVFPTKKPGRTNELVWDIPKSAMLHALISHPIFAGVYAYGRTQTFVDCVDGKLVKRTRRVSSPEDWKVCIMDHHEAYISWEQYQKNQAQLAEVRPRWSMDDNRGPIREGRALLAGLLRCGQCGRKLRVSYNAKSSAMYYCDGTGERNLRRCLSFGSKAVDEKVGELLCRVVEPLALEAAQEAFALDQQEQERALEQGRMRIQAAQYAADRAFEQYDLADPKNRLVVDTLEQRLNAKLKELQLARQDLEEVQANIAPLTQSQRQEIEALSRDFPRLWFHPDTDPSLRKQLLRTTIHEIVVTHDQDRQRLEFTIHWEGDVCTGLTVKKRKTPVGSKAAQSLVETIKELSQTLDDAQIARILNMKKILTPRDLRWTKDRVQRFRHQRGIRQKRQPPDDDRFLTCQQAREYLGVGYNSLLGLIRRGVLHNYQVTDFAPWRIPREELDSEEVQSLVRILKATGRLPKEGYPQNQTCIFQEKSTE